MLFSVIIPVFNASKFLKRCLDSIVCQEFNDYEIILIDDGSTDESPLICDEYSKKYSFIRTIHKENGGTVSARRRGAVEAKGNYLLSIDADDYVDSDYFETISKELSKNNFPSILAWSYQEVDESSNTKVKILNQKDTLGNYSSKKDIEELKKGFLYNDKKPNLNYGVLFYSFWTKAYKRELLLDAFMSFENDINYGEDLICLKRILDNPNCTNISVVDYYGYNYVTNSNSLINSSYSIKKFKSYEQTVCELKTTFVDEKGKVYIFAIRALIGLLISMVRASNTFKEFKEKIEESYSCEKIWNYARKAKIKHGRNDKIKIFLIKHKFFRAFYKIFKR